MNQAQDALLCSYYGQETPVSLKDLYAKFPRIDPDRINAIAASLERDGLIRKALEGSHVITPKGRSAYLADIDE